MKIVKDDFTTREYIVYFKNLKYVESYIYIWDPSIKKYVPNFNSVIERDVTEIMWTQFKEEYRSKGYIHIDESIKGVKGND